MGAPTGERPAPVLPPVLYWSPSLAARAEATDPGTVFAGVIDFTSTIAWAIGEDRQEILPAGLPDDAVRLVVEHPARADR
jgi:hypothetical protein